MSHRAAYSELHGALRSGRIVKPKKCSACRKAKRVEAHHRDHDEPLTVEWVCSTCHGALRCRLIMWGDLTPAMRSAVREKAKREGISLRALILSLLKAWVSK